MKNPFEAGLRKVIPATLIYVLQGDDVLMMSRDRTDRVGDVHQGKFNGIGGKLELGESAQEGAYRELFEEAQISSNQVRLHWLGNLQFPEFKIKDGSRDLGNGVSEDWWVTVFVADLLGARPTEFQCPEGSLHWIKRSQVLGLNLWEGDRLFLPRVFERKPFFGTFWYRDGRLTKHEILGGEGHST
jgi:8-oxo-dGTP diphosphatase